jgi:transcriptional regulator with XRE-family HTH domain
MYSFSKRLKELREEYGLSLQDVADKCGISKSSIHLYEIGKRNPKQKALEELSCLFNVDIDYLLGKTDIKNAAANAIGFNSLEEAYKSGEQKEKPSLPDGLTEDERFWVEIYRNVSPEIQDLLLKMVSSFDQQSDESRQMLIRLLRAALGDQA